MEDRGFLWRSAILFVLKWLGIGILPLLVILGIVGLIRNQSNGPKTSVSANKSPSPSVSALASPSPTATVTPFVFTTSTVSPSPSPTSKGSLQVLNGTDTSGLATEAAQKLKKAGYSIVTVQPAAKKYERSTVFYQPGYETLARDAAAVVGAKVIQPAPTNLDKRIPVTVVVGADYKR